MHEELTNLLPLVRERQLLRQYFLRTGVVGVALVTALTLSAGILLIPTYVLLNHNEEAKRIQRANIESRLSPTDDATLSARLATLSENTAALVALSKAPSPSSLLRDVLHVSRPGIILSGFAYTPPSGGKAAALLVSGSAATREALRAYQLALEESPFVRSAALPVSAYAQDTDIAFTITLTLTP